MKNKYKTKFIYVYNKRNIKYKMKAREMFMKKREQVKRVITKKSMDNI